MSCCRNKGNNQTSCCGKDKGSNQTSCCSKNNKINKEEYDELKEYFKEEIKDYKLVDYMDDDNKHKKLVEVEFEDYILELEDIKSDEITLDIIIDSIIKDSIK